MVATGVALLLLLALLLLILVLSAGMHRIVGICTSVLMLLGGSVLLVPSFNLSDVNLLGDAGNLTSAEELFLLLGQNGVPAAPPPPQLPRQPPRSSMPSTPAPFPSSPWLPPSPLATPTASRRALLLGMAGILTAGRRADEAAAGARKVDWLVRYTAALQLAVLLDASRGLIWPEQVWLCARLEAHLGTARDCALTRVPSVVSRPRPQNQSFGYRTLRPHSLIKFKPANGWTSPMLCKCGAPYLQRRPWYSCRNCRNRHASHRLQPTTL